MTSRLHLERLDRAGASAVRRPAAADMILVFWCNPDTPATMSRSIYREILNDHEQGGRMSGDNSPARRIRNQRKYREFRARALRLLGDTCAICGHADATDLDHIVPVSQAPELALRLDNVQPAHGVTGCPHCPPIVTANGVKRPACNQSRGTGDASARAVPVSQRSFSTAAEIAAMSDEQLRAYYKATEVRRENGVVTMVVREW